MAEIFEPVDPEALAEHMFKRHVMQPIMFSRMGVEYDAELAKLHGVTLQGVANEMQEALGLLTAGPEDFAESRYASEIIRLYPNHNPRQHIPDDESLEEYLARTGFQEHLATELSRLVQLGVADPSAFPAIVTGQLQTDEPLPSHYGETLIERWQLELLQE